MGHEIKTLQKKKRKSFQSSEFSVNVTSSPCLVVAINWMIVSLQC